MKIQLSRINDQLHFRAFNADGAHINIDGPPSIGGENEGLRPMETLLAALATCSAFDVVGILKKQRQALEALDIQVSGDRANKETTRPFSNIHLDFVLSGDIKRSKAERAVQLAVEKYCSVKESLHPNIRITYSFTIQP